MYGEIYAYHLRVHNTVRVTHNKWDEGAPVWVPAAGMQARPPIADVLAEVIELKGAEEATISFQKLQASGLNQYRF